MSLVLSTAAALCGAGVLALAAGGRAAAEGREAAPALVAPRGTRFGEATAIVAAHAAELAAELAAERAAATAVRPSGPRRHLHLGPRVV